MHLLDIDNLDVRYGGIRALQGVTVQVEEGSTVLLVGANGAGKSSLINAVCGVVPPSSGSIRFEGRDIGRVPCGARARLGIGYSPEGRRIFGSLSVEDNILCGAAYRSSAARQQAYDWICATFPLIAERRKQAAGQLSGGEQQIVALARAVCALPRLLLLDEPFLGLAPVWIGRVSGAIRHLQARGTTILMTEQMARPALKLATHVYLLRGGEVRRSGPIDQMRDFAMADEYL